MVTYGADRAAAGAGSTEHVQEMLLHEFAHQWFGDSVTPTDWTGLWLNEGWAMYAEWLWTVEPGLDTEPTWEDWARERDGQLAAEAGPPGNPKPDHFGESNVYLGPALMLHQIRQTVGDDAFFALARDWVQTQRNHRSTGRRSSRSSTSTPARTSPP